MPGAAVTEGRTRAVELARLGMSYDDIAKELGYANRSGAWKAVEAALKDHEAEAVDEQRAPLSVLWMVACAGAAFAVYTRAIDGLGDREASPRFVRELRNKPRQRALESSGLLPIVVPTVQSSDNTVQVLLGFLGLLYMTALYQGVKVMAKVHNGHRMDAHRPA